MPDADHHHIRDQNTGDHLGADGHRTVPAIDRQRQRPVCEAIGLYRARELARRLEEAYRADSAEAARINREWESADAEVSE